MTSGSCRSGRVLGRSAPLLALILGALFAPHAGAVDRYVDDNVNPCAPKNGTLACPYTTVQAGIDAAVVGDVVRVLPGVYLEQVFMKNGVDVISQNGPSVTTIDATGQAFSTVRFSNTVSDSPLVSRLSGFTITGGTGRPRSAANRGAADGAMSGGGIFIYNRNQNVVAPLIDNNVITGNNLVTTSTSNYPLLLGAGIYVAVGRPEITNNMISGNTARRTQGPKYFGNGGGIYATFFGRPIVSYNTISGNIAGDAGGGVAFYGTTGYPEKPELNANLIQGNSSNRVAGAISAGSYSDFTVTNNVIRNNSATDAGGAAYVFYGSLALRNNTVVGNTSAITGGVWIGKTDPVNHQQISNNIITQNTSTNVNYAGGIRALTGAMALGTISFTYNDLVANNPSDYGGIPDPALSPGNLFVAPVFVNAPGGNYRLQPGSPGIDAGSNALAPPFDFDTEPRPLDGSGDNVAVADMGAFELLRDGDGDGIPDDGDRSGLSGDAPCAGGATALCDDNCIGNANPTQADPDGDGVGSACDICPANPDPAQADSDGDGVGDGCDNCPGISNNTQSDADGDGAGDACDNCQGLPNPGQADFDLDGRGDACDNCATVANPSQVDGDLDAAGDACDNCPALSNPGQADGDGDLRGDVCDNCAAQANPGQEDLDGDGLGNVCDPDADGDGAANETDCAPTVGSIDGLPGQVPGVTTTASALLSWQQERQSNVYNIYRADRPRGAPFAYSFACARPEFPGTAWSDPAGPAAGAVSYYLVAGTNACGHGPLGAASSGALTPPPATPCTAQNLDGDGDTVRDLDDNCPEIANPAQADGDHDGQGDVCDPCPADALNDADGDGLCSSADNCPAIPNPTQANQDGDPFGDACDNCAAVPNPGQENGDGDALGDACDACPADALNDADADGVCGAVDNCPAIANPGQGNADGDLLGDACDACPLDPLNDQDADGACGNVDNCPAVANPSQANGDGDANGDACDVCPLDPLDDLDADGVCADLDNCDAIPNPGQQDGDADAVGDACDNCVADANPLQENADGDPRGDACDCAPSDPLIYGPPAGVGNSVAFAADAVTLSWASDAQASSYEIYRGDIVPATPFTYDYTCLGASFGLTTFEDLEAPAARSSFYYVVASASTCGTSGPGVRSNGQPRPAPGGCP